MHLHQLGWSFTHGGSGGGSFSCKHQTPRFIFHEPGPLENLPTQYSNFSFSDRLAISISRIIQTCRPDYCFIFFCYVFVAQAWSSCCLFPLERACKNGDASGKSGAWFANKSNIVLLDPLTSVFGIGRKLFALGPNRADDDGVAGANDDGWTDEECHADERHVQLPLPLRAELYPALQTTWKNKRAEFEVSLRRKAYPNSGAHTASLFTVLFDIYVWRRNRSFPPAETPGNRFRFAGSSKSKFVCKLWRVIHPFLLYYAISLHLILIRYVGLTGS